MSLGSNTHADRAAATDTVFSGETVPLTCGQVSTIEAR